LAKIGYDYLRAYRLVAKFLPSRPIFANEQEKRFVSFHIVLAENVPFYSMVNEEKWIEKIGP